jgi:hypothetical protein
LKEELTLKEKFNKRLKREKQLKILSLSILSVLACLGGYSFGKHNSYQKLEDRVLGLLNINRVERSENYIDKLPQAEEIVDEEDKQNDETVNKENEKDEINKVSPNISSQTPCTQSDIDNYLESFCYWVREDNGDEAANWGEKLSNCGANFSIDNCWTANSSEDELKCSQEEYDYAVAYIEAAEKSYEEVLIDYEQAVIEYEECIYGEPDCDYSGEPAMAPDVIRDLTAQCRENYYEMCEIMDNRDWYAKNLQKIEEGIAQQMIVLQSCY